jgi:predicted DNA-binding transcriptional regulator AlpA
MDTFASVKQVAQRYGVSTATPWRWVNDPVANFPKPVSLSPGCTRWRLSDLEAWENQKGKSCVGASSK